MRHFGSLKVTRQAAEPVWHFTQGWKRRRPRVGRKALGIRNKIVLYTQDSAYAIKWPVQAGITSSYSSNWASQVALLVKNLPTGARDRRNAGSFPGLGRSPGKGHGNPLQYSFLENHMDRGTWQATVHGAIKNQTQLSDWDPDAGKDWR